MNLEKRLKTHHRNQHIKYVGGDKHEYWFYPSGDFRKTSEAVEYDGVTSLIKQFSQPFDKDKIAASCNKNPNSEWYDMGEEAIKEAWAEKGRKSREKGNRIHKAVEDFVNDGVIDEDMSSYVYKFDEEMQKNNLEPLLSEFLVYDKTLQRASMIDDICERSGKAVIVDIKTYSKGMEFSSYGGQKMLPPLDHLPDSKFVRTSLQVSIYRDWLQKKYHTEVSDVNYVLLLNDEECRLIPTLPLKDEIQTLYEWS